MIARAVAAGATLVRPAQDQFYGERSGTVRDPFGHEWGIGHSIEKLAPRGDAAPLHGAPEGRVTAAHS